MKRLRPIVAGLFLVASLLACNLPGAEQVPPPSDVQTQAALTVEALLVPAATSTTQPVSQPPLPDTPTATLGSTATITPTYSVPYLTLRESTNCRLGPGQDYAVWFAYVKGVKLEIIGAYPQLNYWLVKSEESSTGECWVWGEYADITGSYWAVPSVTPPPTPTLTLPTAPSIKWEFNCDYAAGQMITTFTWVDNAVNETGYRVIRNDQAVVELPANSTSYIDTYAFAAGVKVNYQIEAYNITGFTRSAVAGITC